MPLITRLRQVVPALILLSAGWPQASAQQAPSLPPTVQTTPPFVRPVDIPMDPNVINNKRNNFMTAKEAKPGQQAMRIAKGKDYDKLPPEFQWDTAPTPVIAPFPVYPYEQLRAKVAGKVRVYFIIGPEGRVVRTDLDEVVTPEFGLAVRAMLDSCRFKPAKKKDGKPAYAYVGIEYEFAPKGHSDGPVGPEARFILSDLEKKPENIHTPAELDHPLKPVSREPPVYPLALQKKMPAGDAEVEFFVDTNGNVQLPHIKSNSLPDFGFAAVQAVAAWRFEVPTKGGNAVVVRVVVPIGFEGRAPAGQK